MLKNNKKDVQKMFENELKKMTKGIENKITFFSNCAYISISKETIIKIEMTDNEYCGNFNAINLTAINKKECKIDSISINFVDIIGLKRNEINGKWIKPIIYMEKNYNDGKDKIEWDGKVIITDNDYNLICDCIKNYINLFI
jgi:hypothetical protein